jgi:hypothetical protein
MYFKTGTRQNAPWQGLELAPGKAIDGRDAA